MDDNQDDNQGGGYGDFFWFMFWVGVIGVVGFVITCASIP